MLNRLAKAAEEAAEYDIQDRGEDFGETVISNWPEVVRAVLREARNEAPFGAGRRAILDCDLEDGTEAQRCWQAMIDTILDETDET